MEIINFKKYISVKTKKHWFLIGNVYGKGFQVVNWNKVRLEANNYDV